MALGCATLPSVPGSQLVPGVLAMARLASALDWGPLWTRSVAGCETGGWDAGVQVPALLGG